MLLKLGMSRDLPLKQSPVNHPACSATPFAPNASSLIVTIINFRRYITMAINTAKLGQIVQDFVAKTADVQGAAMVTPDGLPLASSLPGGMDEERVSAMSAAMLSLGERIGKELIRGLTDRIYVEGEEGFSILTSCGQDAVFLVLASKAAKQGVLMLEIKRALEDINHALAW
jgi:predicted regulator of Ras-like GTPase activity (Roadblock/LC7/MglB family)